VADRCACCYQVILLADDNGKMDVLEYGYTCEECVAVIIEKVQAMSN
jgi:shikimate kinase